MDSLTTNTARACQFDSASRSFCSWVYEKPTPAAGEVLIRVTCCTICGSDLHTWSGRRGAPSGCVLGHEIIGTIESWGGEASPADFFGEKLRRGQRVTWSMVVGCGDCFYCRNQLEQKCESLFKYGHHSVASAPTGGLSEYCLLRPGTALFPIPDTLSDPVACPVNCATATVAAATRTVRTVMPEARFPDTVLITGAGLLGLTACAWCRDAGTRKILIVDPNPERANLAKRFGATHAISATVSDGLSDWVASTTDRRGVDACFDFAGQPAAVDSCLQSVRTGGCVLLAGSVFPVENVSVAPEQLVRRMLTVRGLHNYRPEDLGRAIRFLERCHGRFPFEQLVAKSFSLDQVAEAFQFAAEEKPVRVAVRPDIRGENGGNP